MPTASQRSVWRRKLRERLAGSFWKKMASLFFPFAESLFRCLSKVVSEQVQPSSRAPDHHQGFTEIPRAREPHASAQQGRLWAPVLLTKYALCLLVTLLKIIGLQQCKDLKCELGLTPFPFSSNLPFLYLELDFTKEAIPERRKPDFLEIIQLIITE